MVDVIQNIMLSSNLNCSKTQYKLETVIKVFVASEQKAVGSLEESQNPSNSSDHKTQPRPSGQYKFCYWVGGRGGG